MSNAYFWYSQLVKPSWAPPNWLFGPVWAILYVIITVSFSWVFYKVFTKKIPAKVILPFILNLVFNFAFTPLQFGLRNNLAASFDILAVLVTIIWLMFIIKPFAKWVVYINIPYLLWVLFATLLQLTITYLNR